MCESRKENFAYRAYFIKVVRNIHFSPVLSRVEMAISKLLEISNVHSERKIFAIFKFSRIWLFNTFKK